MFIPRLPRSQEYGAGRHGERLEAAPAVDAADESLWGRKPGRVAGVGLQEGTRKHAAALRKYLAYYLRLLARIRDVPRLQAAVYCLRLPSTSTQHPGLADLIKCVLPTAPIAWHSLACSFELPHLSWQEAQQS